MKHLKRRVSPLLASCIFVASGWSVTGWANDVAVSVHSYEYTTQFNGANVKFKPKGGFFSAGLTIVDGWTAALSFGKASDDVGLPAPGLGSAEIESAFWSVGLGYSVGMWQLGFGYSNTDDEIDIRHGQQMEFYSNSDKDSESVDLSASYGWVSGPWGYGVAGGLQYNNSETNSFLDQDNIEARNKQHAWYANTEVFGDRYLRFSETSGLYLGGSANAFQELSSSGDNNGDFGGAINQGPGAPPPPGGNRPGGGPNGGRGGAGGGASFNTTTGEHFVLFGLFAVYEINREWSVDVSSEFGAFGDENANSHALTLSYYFE